MLAPPFVVESHVFDVTGPDDFYCTMLLGSMTNHVDNLVEVILRQPSAWRRLREPVAKFAVGLMIGPSPSICWLATIGSSCGRRLPRMLVYLRIIGSCSSREFFLMMEEEIYN